MVRLLLLLCLSLLPTLLYASEGHSHFKIRSAYHFEEISFASDAHGAKFLLSYDEPKKWGVRGRFDYINKFGDSAPGFGLGGTYWPAPSTVLSLDADFGPGQSVIPRQAYQASISQVIFKVLVPAIGYKFSDFETADAHTVMPELTWYFYKRLDWMARYFLTVSELGGRTATDHSMMTKLHWNPLDPLDLFAGYARANESFESGNSLTPVGGFSANHVFTGWNWEIYKGIGLNFSFDYENRNNGSTLETYEVGTSYRW